ncbi:MAG: hypothetical protein ACW99J_17530, partial [Candidatus Thorarchaeota archaeon]
MSTSDQNWNTEVLKELRQIGQSISTLDAKITDTKQSLQDEIHSIRAEILEFQLKSQQNDDVNAWATRFREKITLADIERLKADVDSLREYKA